MKEEKSLQTLLELKAQLKEIETRVLIAGKDILTAKEAATYMGIKMSFLYKLTWGRVIPSYKPTGKLLYFKKAELNGWLLQNKRETTEELITTRMI